MDNKQDVVTIPHAIQYITSAVPLISMASIRQHILFQRRKGSYWSYELN